MPIVLSKTSTKVDASGSCLDAVVATEPIKSRGDAPRKGKKKHAQEEIDTSDFIPRVDSAWAVGAHVSALGGVENTVVNAASIG